MKATDHLIRVITEATASVTGDDFFRALVRHLASELGVRYALVTEHLPNGRARTLALWQDGKLGRNFEYDLPGTPCSEVVAGRVCFHPQRLQQLFPADTHLAKLRAESYHGVPALDSTQRIVGHLAVMDDQPMKKDALRLTALETFAARAGAEIERLRVHADLQRLNLELDALLEINRAIGRHLDRDELFGALAACLRTVVPTERFGIELPIEGDKLQGHILTPRPPGVEPTQPTVLPALGTVCHWVMKKRDWFVSSSRDELRDSFPVTFDVMSHEEMESLCALPLLSGESCRGALFFMAAAKGAYERLGRGFLEQVAGAVAVALDDCLAHEEVRQLRDRLAAENVYLQEEIRGAHNFENIVGGSPALLAVLGRVEQVAPTDSTVLIYGETGTGKELIAHAIHDRSRRRERALVKVNCSAISAGLVESEIFGHVKGAFTGALKRRLGRFEVANGGTIFLDEVGELPLETQVKLLRVLQEGEFEPVGSSRCLRVDVRVIAATNARLEEAIKAGRFRSDLFYRLNVFPIEVPPLRERISDIPLLVTYFLSHFSKKCGKTIEAVTQETMDRLTAYAWPGNVRELQNVIERAVVLAQHPIIDLDPHLLPTTPGTGQEEGLEQPTAKAQPARFLHRGGEQHAPAGGAAPASLPTLREMEYGHILAALEQTAGVIDGPKGAAKILNLHPNTLRSRMQKLGIKYLRSSPSGSLPASEPVLQPTPGPGSRQSF